VTTLNDFGGVLGRPLNTFAFGISRFHGHGSWLVCEVAVSYRGSKVPVEIQDSRENNPFGLEESREFASM
jgi:hypothetical protein